MTPHQLNGPEKVQEFNKKTSTTKFSQSIYIMDKEELRKRLLHRIKEKKAYMVSVEEEIEEWKELLVEANGWPTASSNEFSETKVALAALQRKARERTVKALKEELSVEGRQLSRLYADLYMLD